MLKISLQPYIIFVGSYDSVEEIYVSLDDVLYKVNSMIEAIDVCFKIFHVFEVNYPVSSEHLWLLIQQGIYKFTTKWDSVITNIEFLLNKLEKLTISNVETDMLAEEA